MGVYDRRRWQKAMDAKVAKGRGAPFTYKKSVRGSLTHFPVTIDRRPKRFKWYTLTYLTILSVVLLYWGIVSWG